MAEKIAATIRLDTPLKEELEKLAQVEERSMAATIIRLIKQRLGRVKDSPE
jgi:predicted transcriptional regulator